GLGISLVLMGYLISFFSTLLNQEVMYFWSIESPFPTVLSSQIPGRDFKERILNFLKNPFVSLAIRCDNISLYLNEEVIEDLIFFTSQTTQIVNISEKETLVSYAGISFQYFRISAELLKKKLKPLIDSGDFFQIKWLLERPLSSS